MRNTCFRLGLAVLLPFLALAQDLKEIEKKVTEFTLNNGLHFIIYERHQAPVVSFFTYVDVGSAHDPFGQTGIAHMFEHMAFKGTPAIGSTNYAEEQKALAEVERVYDQLEAERNRGIRADAKKIEALEAELKKAVEKANSYVVPNKYPRIIEEAGGVGLNAGTGVEQTMYFYNLPANRAELWFLLESERFLNPVFREFYKERDVVREELRMRYESNPQGKLMQALMNTAFAASPYRVGPGGWASDVESLRVPEAKEFYRTHYVPNNITIAIAGDVDPARMKQLAEKYFSRLPAGPPPPRLVTDEPPQQGPKQVVIESPSQPMLMMAYKRPSQYHPDDPVFDVVGSILASGRTGMLYKELVRDRKIALAAGTAATFPSGRLDNLFLFYALPNAGHTVEENEKAIYEVIEKLKNEKVDSETLQRVKTKLRAGVIRQLDSNSGMAEQLATYYVNYGDWRKLVTGLEEIEKVTADDVQRVAREYFKDNSKTIAFIRQPEQAKGAGE